MVTGNSARIDSRTSIAFHRLVRCDNGPNGGCYVVSLLLGRQQGRIPQAVHLLQRLRKNELRFMQRSRVYALRRTKMEASSSGRRL